MKNKDGRISSEEIAENPKNLNPNHDISELVKRNKECELLLREISSDGNGQINFKELSDHM